MFLVKFKVRKDIFDCKGIELFQLMFQRKAVNFVPPKEKKLIFKILSGVAV